MTADRAVVVAEALAAHRAYWATGFVSCPCGWETDVLPTGNERNAAVYAHLAAAILAALDLPAQGLNENEREVRDLWAIRWPDGTTSGAMYSDDGSDYAEQTIRVAAGGEEVVHRTETITRTPWETATPPGAPA